MIALKLLFCTSCLLFLLPSAMTIKTDSSQISFDSVSSYTSQVTDKEQNSIFLENNYASFYF